MTVEDLILELKVLPEKYRKAEVVFMTDGPIAYRVDNVELSASGAKLLLTQEEKA